MDTSKIIKKITDDHIRLPSVARLKVTDMSYFLAYAKIPYYKVSRPEKGYIWSERPRSLRHIEKNTNDEFIRKDFLAGRLELLDFRGDRPIPVDEANQFNPFILSIAFDEFVRYAKLRGVTVTVEDDAYFDRWSNDVFLKVLDIAELVVTDAGTNPTDEAILNEADSWVNECFRGTVIYESNEVDIDNYASEQDAVLDNYIIELNSAIDLAEILKKPTQRLKEKLAELCPVIDTPIGQGQTIDKPVYEKLPNPKSREERLNKLREFISKLEGMSQAKKVKFDKMDLPLTKPQVLDELNKRYEKNYGIGIDAFEAVWKSATSAGICAINHTNTTKGESFLDSIFK